MNVNTINDDVTMAGEDARALLMNRYRIVKQLGQGGMGSVWLVEDVQLDGKFFAIKMLPSVLFSNKRAYQQLKSEALVSMRLVHPNIVALRAFEENDGNPFLVMDFIEGRTLDDYLGEKGVLSEKETIQLLKPIAEALDYAHKKGVVHRDVKPSNIMIDKEGNTYVLDFGIAREIQETMTSVTGKMSSGTLLYMSPEQLRGQPPKPPQDVYSFSAMVYECLKGRPPFSRGQVEYQILNEKPEPLSAEFSLASSVMVGLAKTPEERMRSCMAVFDISAYPNTVPSGVAGTTDVRKQEFVVRSESRCGEVSDEVLENTRSAIAAFEEERWEEALKLFPKADSGNSIIQFYIGWMYATGCVYEKDVGRAVEWFRKSADQGVAEAQFELGFGYERGLGVPQDYGAAVKWYRMSAEQGDPRAQCNLGAMYQNGWGVECDCATAVMWYRLSAEQGDPRAQCNLGAMYQNGWGVGADCGEAVKWYSKSAEQGDSLALCNLGFMYENGAGVARDYGEAIRLYRMSADLRDSMGEYRLGLMYKNGWGTNQDYAEAVKCYRKSADHLNSWGQNALGLMYKNGCGVMQNYFEAVNWFRKSAEQGNPLGQYNLARMYSAGWGVAMDCDEAVKWYEKAASQGLEAADEALARFGR